MTEIDEIIKSIKSDLGAGIIHRINDPDLHSNITYWIPTGSTLLDAAIGKGIPGKRITEISGQYSSGKSALCYSILANTQKMGGLAVLIDTESAINSKFAEYLGVNTDELLISQPDTVEDTYQTIKDLIPKLREKFPHEKPITICIDSCTPTTREEMEKDLNEENRIGANAKAQRRGLRILSPLLGHHNITLVGINHTTANIGVMYGPKTTTTGGTAWGFWPAVRIKLRVAQKLRDKENNVIGIEVKTEVEKNKVGPPHKEASFNIYFDRGIDDLSSVVQFMRTNGLFGDTKGWWTWKDKKYREAEIITMFQQNPEELEELRLKAKEVIG